MKNLVVTIIAVAAMAAIAVSAPLSDQEAGLLQPGDTVGVSYAEGPNGATIVSFPEVTGEFPRRELNGFGGYATLGSNADAFTGDYTAAGITGLKVAMSSDGPLCASVKLVLKSGDRTWRVRLNGLTDTDGETQVFEVPFDVDSGWYASVSQGTAEAALAADLSDVDMIGITIAVCKAPAQTFTISSFALMSDGGDIPVDLTPLEQRLKDRFGVTSAGDVTGGSGDGDLDGLSLLEETILGTDDQDPNSGLAAEVVARTADSAVIRWGAGAADVDYTVLRAESLTSGFSPLAGASGISATSADADGNIYWTDDTVDADTAYFYRVVGVTE